MEGRRAGPRAKRCVQSFLREDEGKKGHGGRSEQQESGFMFALNPSSASIAHVNLFLLCFCNAAR